MTKVLVKQVPGKGRGVFAAEAIPDGALIEECELILIKLAEVGEELERYIYGYSPKKAAIALGNGSLYNHSSQPNAYFDFDRKNRRLQIFTLRQISQGEEITFNYGYDEELLLKFKFK